MNLKVLETLCCRMLNCFGSLCDVVTALTQTDLSWEWDASWRSSTDVMMSVLTVSQLLCLCLCRQPWYYGWGFNLPRGQALLDKWNQVPENTDILVTHCPPLGETQITAHAHSHRVYICMSTLKHMSGCTTWLSITWTTTSVGSCGLYFIQLIHADVQAQVCTVIETGVQCTHIL